MCRGRNDPPDIAGTEAALVGLAESGAVRRSPIGDDCEPLAAPLPDRRLILVRHGATAWNAEGRFTTPNGRRALARRAASRPRPRRRALAGVGIDRVDLLAASPGARDGRGDRRGAPGRAARDHRRAPARDRRRAVRGPDRRRDRGRADGRASSTDGGPRPTPSLPDGAETYESAVARARSFFGDVRDLPGDDARGHPRLAGARARDGGRSWASTPVFTGGCGSTTATVRSSRSTSRRRASSRSTSTRATSGSDPDVADGWASGRK